MKILFVSSLSSYYSNENSSYMQRLTFLKEGLEKLGVEADMIYLGDYIFGKPALLSPFVANKLKKRMETYDFVHAGGTGSAYAVSVIKKLFKTNINLIYDVHGDAISENYLFKKGLFDFVSHFKIFQAKIMEYVSKKYSDYFITCSTPLEHLYIKQGITSDRIKVVTNSVDTVLFKPNKELIEKNDNFIVTYAGGFQEWQGIEMLLDAAEILSEEDIIFRIIGFQKENYDLKKGIKEKLGNKSELIEALPREKLVCYLNKSDALIIPRQKNKALDMAFPTKFAEYISMEKPIILTDVSEAAELVKKFKCGLVCEANSDSLAESIKIVKNFNQNQLILMGKNGRKLAKNQLDKNIICKRYLDKLIYWKKQDA